MESQEQVEDWEKDEITSLLKEAQTLRSQKEQLEAQIGQAEDANASLQSSWGALSRVSTALASNSSSMRPSPLKATEVPWPMYNEVIDDEPSEVLTASQQSLQMDLELLRQRVADAEASRQRAEEESLTFKVREDQAKELADLLRELQAMQGRVEHGSQQLSAANQQHVEKALVTLRSSHSKLRKEGEALQAQILELKQAPKAAEQQRLAQEAQCAKRGLQEARELWQAQVHIRRSALKVEEKELAKLSGRQEACHLAVLEGRRVSSDLSSKVAQLRLEYGRLLTWQQAHASGQDLDPFGLKATADQLRSGLKSLEDQLQGLRKQETEDQAKLEQKRMEEAADVRALQAKNTAELRAFEVCCVQLQRVGQEMTQEVRSLQLDLQRECSIIEALRERKARMLSAWPRRSPSAPTLVQQTSRLSHQVWRSQDAARTSKNSKRLQKQARPQ